MPVNLRKRRARIGRIATACVFAFIVLLLVKTQLIDGEKYKSAAESMAVATSTVKADRGEILDCNGNPLVTNRLGNSIVFKYATFPDTQKERNEVIFALINLLEKEGFKWIDMSPVVYGADGKLTIDKKKTEEF